VTREPRLPAAAAFYASGTAPLRSCHTFGGTVTFVAKTRAKAATAWGDATIVDEVAVPQRAGERRFSSIVQLLENERGERLVRFAYSTDGTARRGPVTLRAKDVEKLRAALAEHHALAEALRL
jgi:hypothetical protein